jgi:uncharacterized Zn finger protein (UPF0148 family)
MQDEKISKITEMLLAGGKMLGIHCGTCESPLFEFKGKISCPVCGVPEKKPPPKKVPEAGPEPKALEKLEKALYSKLESLSEQLKKETDHAKTVELLNGIKAALETLERLKG